MLLPLETAYCNCFPFSNNLGAKAPSTCRHPPAGTLVTELPADWLPKSRCCKSQSTVDQKSTLQSAVLVDRVRNHWTGNNTGYIWVLFPSKYRVRLLRPDRHLAGLTWGKILRLLIKRMVLLCLCQCTKQICIINYIYSSFAFWFLISSHSLHDFHPSAAFASRGSQAVRKRGRSFVGLEGWKNSEHPTLLAFASFRRLRPFDKLCLSALPRLEQIRRSKMCPNLQFASRRMATKSRGRSLRIWNGQGWRLSQQVSTNPGHNWERNKNWGSQRNMHQLSEIFAFVIPQTSKLSSIR